MLRCPLSNAFPNQSFGITLSAKGELSVGTMDDPQDCQEPDVVYPEEEFEKALASVIQAHLRSNVASKVVPRFGLDIAIFLPHPIASRVLFVEAKSYGLQRQGGIGFGDRHGKGPQVDFLLSSVDQLAILNSHVLWAFADATQPRGTTRYALLTCSEARDAAMGGVAREKQNNFRMSMLNAHRVAWPTFCEKLLTFL